MAMSHFDVTSVSVEDWGLVLNHERVICGHRMLFIGSPISKWEQKKNFFSDINIFLSFSKKMHVFTFICVSDQNHFLSLER